jgi:hypothetical protein
MLNAEVMKKMPGGRRVVKATQTRFACTLPKTVGPPTVAVAANDDLSIE